MCNQCLVQALKIFLTLSTQKLPKIVVMKIYLYIKSHGDFRDFQLSDYSVDMVRFDYLDLRVHYKWYKNVDLICLK